MTTPETPAPEAAGIKARARRLAAPVVNKARQEIVRAAADDQSSLRAEVAELRDELARQRAEHQAELAGLQEELAAVREELAAQASHKRR
ncbi:MAG: hypothetical protein U0P45_06370 [Acidimicrobiales bacterium]